MSEQQDDDDDWCELCGSTECVNGSECKRAPVGELPGARLERLEKEERERVHQATQELFMQKLIPEPKEEDNRTLEEFERQLGQRAKVEVVTRLDGTTYRRRV